MSTIDVLWLAHLNRNIEDAGSDSTINLTINVDGDDVLDRDFGSNVGDGEAYLNGGVQLDTPFDSAAITNSSVRIGVRDDDAWAPGDVLVFGHSMAEFNSGVAVPLAMETGLTDSLSTDLVGGTAHRAAAAGRAGDLQHPHSARPAAGPHPVVGGRNYSGRRKHRHGQRHPIRGFRRGEPRSARRDRRHLPVRPREGHIELVCHGPARAVHARRGAGRRPDRAQHPRRRRVEAA